MRVISWLLILGVIEISASRLDAQEYLVGTARVDITPDGPIRLAGYGDRTKPSEGVEQRLFAKALAIREGGGLPLVLVTADVIGFTRSVADRITARLES